MSKKKNIFNRKKQEETVTGDKPADQQKKKPKTGENGRKSTDNQPTKPKKKLTPLKKLKLEMEELQQQHADLRDKYIRLVAEFDNYKKRTLKEKIEFMKTASQDTLSALLPVLDDFDRAKKNAEDENSAEHFSDGVELVYTKLYSVLKQKGLEPMDTTGEKFDPEIHDAFTELPAPSKKMKGKIIDTIEKGYKLKDKIIRHAKVVVGK